eukprot:4031092-Amphidinium_carterae.1
MALKELNPRRVALDEVHGQCVEGSYPSASHVVKGPVASLCTKCLQSAYVPDSWYHGNLVPIHKRNASFHCPASYRPVMLLRSEFKLYAKVVLRRIQSEVRDMIGQYGCGSGVVAQPTMGEPKL